MPFAVPPIRIRRANALPPRPDAAYVLYWMIAFRRLRWNFALQRAVEWAERLGLPLLICEALRCDYRWASARHHQFAVDGMAERIAVLGVPGDGGAVAPVAYYPYVEPRPGAGKGLLAALAAQAAVVVTDDAPVFFLPHMVAAAAARLPVALEAVDANGLLPLAAVDRTCVSAYQFRRLLQHLLPEHLAASPAEKPLARRLPPFPRDAAGLPALPAGVLGRWPPLPRQGVVLAELPVDATVAPVAGVAGGERPAAALLRAFVRDRLPRYHDERNHPDAPVTSGLAPYLHWGCISTHHILAAVAAAERWTPERLGRTASGAREGWWGMSAGAEGFLDQVVTWREVGFNMAARRAGDHERYESLPDWAQATLDRHSRDPRPELYGLDDLAAANTGDELWNAAQRQLRREGTIHNYLRMLWGKRVLEWSPSPRQALAWLVELNNRYALDGRDPNSYSGIFWCLGRYDRPWAPERPIFGTIRFMSSQSARRKLRLEGYLARYGAGKQPGEPAGAQARLC